MGAMTWASTADCAALTGYTPDTATLALAQTTVETHVNRTPAAEDSFRLRDFDWLKRAVAFQAAWLASQPGYLARMGAANVSQDGLSSTFNSPADLTLAPLAQRACKNLSWMGSRSVQTRPRQPLPEFGALAPSAAAFLHSGSDPEDGWEPL